MPPQSDEPEPEQPQQAPQQAPIKNLTALAAATEETEADLLNYSAEELARGFEHLKMDVFSQKKILREMDNLRQLLLAEDASAAAKAPVAALVSKCSDSLLSHLFPSMWVLDGNTGRSLPVCLVAL